jgi:hypothetical protein
VIGITGLPHRRQREENLCIYTAKRLQLSPTSVAIGENNPISRIVHHRVTILDPYATI